ncbi:hypothetical protein PRIPAC_78340, partial [Pristionchus pacificus]|uniref:Uncharacterized protein n=1 Tax=Pristionchus pacificus TaxID=54126 RepID=A0A2A6BWJ6_PRIPA
MELQCCWHNWMFGVDQSITFETIAEQIRKPDFNWYREVLACLWCLRDRGVHTTMECFSLPCRCSRFLLRMGDSQ